MFILNVIQLLSKLDIEIYKYKNNVNFLLSILCCSFKWLKLRIFVGSARRGCKSDEYGGKRKHYNKEGESQ